MQRVIFTVRTTLLDLKLAIDGTIIMSQNLRDALDSMFDAKIPQSWLKVKKYGKMYYHYLLCKTLNSEEEAIVIFVFVFTGQVGLGGGSWPSNRTNAGSPPSEFDYTS